MNWRTLNGAPPRIIAHRGASGPLPEHTLVGYALALGQGADVIEPDLVPSRDGVLLARHEPTLARSTDIAGRGEFAARRRGEDWYSIDFDAAELDTLRAVQPFPGRNRAYDGLHRVPHFADILRWAELAAAERGRPVILYPEIKHPTELAAAGHDPVPRFIEAVASLPPGVEVWVQCFEPGPLRRVYDATGMNCCLLLDKRADWGAALAEHGHWLFALGADKRLLIDAAGRPSALIEAAHAAGVRVDAYTFRDDAVAPGFARIEDELAAAMRLGVDGLFCDFPATAIAVREGLA